MSIESGNMLLHYRLIEKIGEGGMGVVWKALDTTLDREVAIKVLPASFADDPERIARFQREARALASLQHPNIASIYGFEQSEGVRFLVMELVEGEDLLERMKRGPIPIEDATELMVQLTEGLEAAHAEGIVHRDLKPANIKLTPDGGLKILDFGLARAYTGDPGSDSSFADSPTITAAMTQVGTILGTAAYMSPEQARGKRVDHRADIWALGVILFEMLMGRQLFAGETISDTLAAVLRAEPDWNDLPAATPPNLHRLLRRCLQRNPKKRLQAAGDARLELIEPETAPLAESVKPRFSVLPIALIVLALAILAGAWFLRPRETAMAERSVTHLSLALPAGVQVASRDKLPLGAPQPCLAISDDGRLIVAVVERDETTWLYRRFLDEPAGVLLDETAGAYHPQISPDGEWISFLTGNALMRVKASGGRPTMMLELPNSFGHTWINNDEIVINRAEARELVRIDVERGTVTEFERGTLEDEFFWPSRVPGIDAILINSQSHVAKSEEAETDQVSLMDLDSVEQTVLGIGGSMPRIAPDGSLLLVRAGSLMAAPFDIDDLEAQVRPVEALEGMLVEGWIGQYAVSRTGTMAYVAGEWLFGTELVWDDGQGNVESTGFPLLAHGSFQLSPDGSQVAVTVGGNNDAHTWIYDLERHSRRLLTTAGTTWSPDGTRVAFGSVRDGKPGIFVRTVGSDEPAERLVTSDIGVGPATWHPQAGLLYYSNFDIMVVDPDNPGEGKPVLATDASEWGPSISPDGRWMAYTSDESGRYEIYVRAVDGDRSWSVSLDGGEEPIFSMDGKTIYFRYGNRFYATPVLEASTDGSRFRPGTPVVIVEGAYSNVPGISYDVHPDGRLLVLRTDGGTERPGHLNVILNWDVELERRLDADR